MRSARVSATIDRLLARPIAHRGLHACGSAGPVENSLGAARAAIERGYGIECDVRLSRDGEAMVFHDASLERLTGRDALVADCDAATLGGVALKGGPDRVPPLSALLAAVGGRVPLVVEIKSDDDGDMRLAERTMHLLRAYEGPAAVESFDPQVVLRCRSLGPLAVGLIGPAAPNAVSHPEVFAACDFISWSIEALAAIPAELMRLPRTTWTVRTQDQAADAASHYAQIVFEGFEPDELLTLRRKIGGAPS